MPPQFRCIVPTGVIRFAVCLLGDEIRFVKGWEAFYAGMCVAPTGYEGACSPTSYFNAFSAADKQAYEKRLALEVYGFREQTRMMVSGATCAGLARAAERPAAGTRPRLLVAP